MTSAKSPVPAAVRIVSDAERRARLGRRHGLAGAKLDQDASTGADVAAAARAVVCLHATEASTVHLSAWARTGATRAQVQAALYDQRTLVKQLAMGRTSSPCRSICCRPCVAAPPPASPPSSTRCWHAAPPPVA